MKYGKGPGLKPLIKQSFFQWPEGHCSLRKCKYFHA